MALFSAIISVPANTLPADPKQYIIAPTVGFLRSVKVMFPDGCLGAVGFRIYDRGRQLAPLPSGWIGGRNNETIEWMEMRRLEGPPYEIMIEAYNEADDWPHSLHFTFDILR